MPRLGLARFCREDALSGALTIVFIFEPGDPSIMTAPPARIPKSDPRGPLHPHTSPASPWEERPTKP